MVLADGIDQVLDPGRVALCGQVAEPVGQVLQRFALLRCRIAELLLRLHEVAEVVQRIADKAVQHRVGFRRGVGGVAGDEAPEHRLVLRVADAGQVQQHAEADRRGVAWWCAFMDVPDGVLDLLRRILFGELRLVGQIVIDGLRDDIEVQALGPARLLEHEQRQALRTGIGQPFVDGQAVAGGLGDLPAFLVEEQLVIEALRRGAAQDAADASRQAHGIDQVLARHLVVHAQRAPAHGPIGLPLHLHLAAGDTGLHHSPVGALVDDGAAFRMHFPDRHHQHLAGVRVDGQEGAVGRPPLRPQRRQDDVHDLLVMLQEQRRHRVELTGAIAVGGGAELIVEAEGIQKRAQPRIVVMAEALVRAEGVRDLRQRLADVLRHHLPVRHVARHLAQPVHVVGKGDQPRRHVRQAGKGMAHHGRACHFPEGADVRQAGGAVAGLEQDVALVVGAVPVALQQFPRFLEWPGVGFFREFSEGRHGYGLVARSIEGNVGITVP